MKYLSKRNNIFLGTTLDQRSDEEYINELRPYCKAIHAVFFNKKARLLKCVFSNLPLSVAHFYDLSLQHFVDKILKEKEIDVVICFCSTMAEYIFRTPSFIEKQMDGIQLIMDYVDLDSDKWLSVRKTGLVNILDEAKLMLAVGVHRSC